MTKVYQQIVIEESDNLLLGLIESDFFKEHEITDLTFAKEYILNFMNEKYISGLLGETEEELITEDEFSKMLIEIITGTVLYELKESGHLNSYEDENTEEMFFLTEKGKELIKEIKNERPE